MATKTGVLNVRTDEKIKRQAQKAAKELGIPLSVVVNASLRTFIRDRRIELEPLLPNVRTARELDAARKEPRGKIFDSAQELFDEIDR